MVRRITAGRDEEDGRWRRFSAFQHDSFRVEEWCDEADLVGLRDSSGAVSVNSDDDVTASSVRLWWGKEKRAGGKLGSR